MCCWNMYYIDSEKKTHSVFLNVLKDTPTSRCYGMLNYEDGNIYYKLILKYFSHDLQL